MKQTLKNIFKPLEVALKKAFGIRKRRRGQIFDSGGVVCDSHEKITRFVLFIPFFQKIRILTNVSEFGNDVTSINGGGEYNPKTYLYTIKTTYKIFGILIFCKTATIIKKTRLAIRADIGSDDWMNIGKYIATNPNIEQEILALIRDLDKENKNFILRQMALSLEAYQNNNSAVTKLTQKEIADIIKEREEFWPNLFKISDNLYAYDGYLLPTNKITAEAFFYKYGLDVLEPQTLAKMRQKEFIDVGGYIGDSAIMFEREFCDKNIYSFEATQTNFILMERTLELNNSKRIIPINKGLGAEKGTLQINIFGDCSGFYKSFGGKTENVEVITLDEFVRENKIEVGFIKTDIEGFEMEFLKGAKETICTQKPTMAISIYHFGKDYFHIKPLIESWNLGYSFKFTKSYSPTLTTGTVLLCEILD